MPQPIKLPFPKQGIIRTFERSVQTGQSQGYYSQFLPESTWNAINVVPYDRFDRLRGGTRPGTKALFGGQIDGGPVTAMAQTVTYKSSPPVTLIADNFSPGGGGGWTAGQALEQHGSWTVYQTASTGSGFSTPIDALTRAVTVTPSDTNIVATTGVQYLKRGAIDQGVGCIRSVPSSYADNYTIQVTSAGAVATGQYKYCVLRYNPANPTAFIVVYIFMFNTGAIPVAILTFFDNLGNTLGNGTITWGGVNNNYAVTVQGNNITVSAGGLPDPGGTPASFTLASAVGAGNLGIGFGLYWGGGSGSPSPVTSFIATSNPPPPPRQVNLVATAASRPFGTQDVFIGTLAGIARATNGAGVVAAGVVPQICYTAGQVYIVDGTSILQVDVPNNTMTPYAATAGTAPTNTTVCTVWRGRLVLAHNASFPQNFYMSRVGVPTDWDYSQVDPAAAFAGNASTAGHIGEPITALMPFTDDVLLIGGDSNLWRVNGDPQDGGSIDLVSDAIGVLGPNAWTKDPTGNIWFAGTGGLYKIAPNGQPENMSAKTFNLPFTTLDRTKYYINLVWNRDLQGLNIFFGAIDQSVGTHLWYDARNGGLWQFMYPAAIGPASALVYDGNGTTDRVTLLGCFDGVIRASHPTYLDDDGTVIATLLSLGPVQVGGPATDAIISGLDVTLGENAPPETTAAVNVTWTLKGGKSAYEVTQGTPRHVVSGVFTYPGRQLTRRPRLRGGWFAVELFNNVAGKYWGLEQVVIHVDPQGKQR